MSDASFSDRALLALIVKEDFGRAGEAERARLAAVLDQNPDLQVRRDDLQFMWDMLGELNPPSCENTFIPHGKSFAEPFVAPVRRFTGRALAACLAAGIVLGAALVGIGGTAGSASAFVIETGKAERRIADLSDGSTIELSGDSRVTIDLTPGRRVVRIDRGEAYVRAALGDVPLVVRAGIGTLRVTGSVDVDLRRSGVLVTLVTGDADIVVANGETEAPQSAQLSVGQQVRFAALSGPMPGSMMTAPKKVDAVGALDWTRGLLEFHGEPLIDVIDEVNRHSTGRIVLLDRSKSAMPVYGVLHIGDLDGLVSMLRDQQGPRTRSGRIVRVEGAIN